MKTVFPDDAAPSAHRSVDRTGTSSLDIAAHNAVEAGSDPATEGGTRAAIIRQLVARPATAVEIAERLGITPAGVRRHLDALVQEQAVTSRENCAHRPRGRGRPPREYLLTDAGRSRLPHAYDDLAADALAFVNEMGGPQAVIEFARRRAQSLVAAHQADLAAASDASARTHILATALTERGFAASVADVGAGQQLCQHHCPVAHVAAQFPQLCQAELEVFTEAIGSYAQRIATIARGDSFCTTFVPGGIDQGTTRTAVANQTVAPPMGRKLQ